MKRIATILLILLSLQGFSQVTSVKPVDLTGRGTTFHDLDSLMLVYNGTVNTATLSNLWTSYLKAKADAIYATQAAVALKVNILDTAAMLANYAKQSAVNLKVNISDTAAMLTNYEKSAHATTTYVPKTTTVNSHALSANVTVTSTDVGLGSVPNVDATNAANISSGTLPDARLSTNVTKQGNTFNGVSQLVQMGSDGKLPAIDGSKLTNIPGSVNGNIPYIVATQYGIVNDGITNNYTRLKTIIDSLVAIGDHKQGGIIWFPKGKYEFWLTSAATGYYIPRILIHGSNIQLIGEDEYNTIFQFKGTGGTDPQTNFDTFFDPTYPTDSVIVRSPGIQIKADSPTDTLRGIWVTNLTLDGGCWKLKYNNHYPTFKDQTNQWDISHKAINIYADGQTNTDDLHFTYLYSKNWMGEHIYSGGNQNKRLFIERSRFHNSNASIISCGGTLFIDRNELDSGINGMECYTGPGRSIVSNNLVHDMWDSTGSSANGIVWGGATVTAYDDMEANISGNIVWNIVKVGIYSLRMNREVKINNNTTLDCGVGIAIEPFDESVEGIDVSTNTVKTKFRTMSTGIAIFGGGSAGLLNDNVAIHDNYIYPTDTAKNSSHYITNGIQFYNTKGDASIFNNLIGGHTNGLVDGQFGTNTVNYPRQYGNKYTDAEFTNGVNLSSGATLTIWPLEKFGITNFTDGSFTVNIDCDPAKALTGSEMTVTKLDALTQYTFQSSNTHFDLSTNITLGAVNDWITFIKGKTGKWEIKAKRQRS